MQNNTNEKRLNNLSLWTMLIPATIILILFAYIPMVGVKIAFEKFIPAFGFFGKQKFVGLDNIIFAFKMPGFWQVILNTLLIAVGKILLGTFSAIALALIINEVPQSKFIKAIQTIIYIPHFISWVILSGIFIQIFDPNGGLVNNFLNVLGIPSIYFLGDSKIFPFFMITTDVWKELGFSTIVYLAAISTIDTQQYEAAKIDGAGRFQLMIHITLPGMKNIIALNALLSIGNIFNAGFDQIFNLYSPQVYETGEVLDTLIYKLGLQQRQYGVSTAVSLCKSVVAGSLMGTFYYVANKWLDYKVF